MFFVTVWLATGHLWKDACHCEARCAIAKHVKAFCQGCHLRFDVEMRVEHARATRRARKDSRRPLLVEG